MSTVKDFATIHRSSQNTREWRLIVRGNKFVIQYKNNFGDDVESWHNGKSFPLSKLQSEVERKFMAEVYRWEIETSLTDMYTNTNPASVALLQTNIDMFAKYAS